MRSCAILLASFTLAIPTFAQEPGKPIVKTSAPIAETYTIQLTEYRTVDKLDDKLSSDAILASIDQLRKSSKIELMESIRLSAIDQYESSVSLAKNVSVVSGVTATPQGRSQSTQQLDIGTIMNVMVERQGESLAVTLNYVVSRVNNAVDERRPDIDRLQFKTKLSLKLDEPRLVSSASSEKTTFLVITIKK